MNLYLQEAMGDLVINQLPEQLAQSLDQIITQGSFVWEQPPRVPWQSLFARNRQWHHRARPSSRPSSSKI